jgi:hypothetical protein
MSDQAPPTPPRPVPAPTRKVRKWKDLALRGALVAVALGAVYAIWWSVKRLEPLQKQTKTLSATVARLDHEINLMDSKWDTNAIQNLASKFEQAQGQLYSGQNALDAWIEDLREKVVPLALEARVDFSKGTAQSVSDKKLTVVSATLSVEVKPTPGVEATKPPYHRLLLFSRQLLAQEKRADFVELTVTAGTNSISRAVAVLNLWAGDENL